MLAAESQEDLYIHVYILCVCYVIVAYVNNMILMCSVTNAQIFGYLLNLVPYARSEDLLIIS